MDNSGVENKTSETNNRGRKGKRVQWQKQKTMIERIDEIDTLH